jgi:hypothetical protein
MECERESNAHCMCIGCQLDFAFNAYPKPVIAARHARRGRLRKILSLGLERATNRRARRLMDDDCAHERFITLMFGERECLDCGHIELPA